MDAMLNYAVSSLEAMAASNPKLFVVLGILYLIGLGAKSVRLAIEAYVKETPSEEDDKKLAEVEGNKYVKFGLLVLDFFFRFKKEAPAKK